MKVAREVCLFFFLVCLQFQLNSVHGSVTLNLNYERGSSFGTAGRLVKKHERMPLLSTEFGSISTVDIDDGTGRHNYHLQFITLEPNSLFLPVLLHADMVFFVHTGIFKVVALLCIKVSPKVANRCSQCLDNKSSNLILVQVAQQSIHAGNYHNSIKNH